MIKPCGLREHLYIPDLKAPSRSTSLNTSQIIFIIYLTIATKIIAREKFFSINWGKHHYPITQKAPMLAFFWCFWSPPPGLAKLSLLSVCCMKDEWLFGPFRKRAEKETFFLLLDRRARSLPQNKIDHDWRGIARISGYMKMKRFSHEE